MDNHIKFLCLFHQLITDLRGLKYTVWAGFTFSQMSSSLRVSFSSVFTSADSRKKYLEQSSYAWLFLTCVVDELKKNLTEPVGQLKRDI